MRLALPPDKVVARPIVASIDADLEAARIGQDGGARAGHEVGRDHVRLIDQVVDLVVIVVLQALAEHATYPVNAGTIELRHGGADGMRGAGKEVEIAQA